MDLCILDLYHQHHLLLLFSYYYYVPIRVNYIQIPTYLGKINLP